MKKRSSARRTQAATQPSANKALTTVCLILAATGSYVSAANYTWDNGAGTSIWDNNINWSSDTLPTFADTAKFDSTLGGSTAITLSTDQTVGTIEITNNVTTNFSLNGAKLTLNTGALTSEAQSQTTTINNEVALGADGTWEIKDSTGRVTMSSSSVISGGFSLDKTGSGALTLAGANTFGGISKSLTLSAGTLNLNNASALGAVGTVLIIKSNTTIDNSSGAGITLLGDHAQNWRSFTFTGTNSLNLGAGAVSLSGDTTLTVAANTLTVGGVISGGSKLIKAGAGTLTLNGANTFGGNKDVELVAGTLNIGHASALGVATNKFKLSGGTFDNTSGGALTTVDYLQAWNGNFSFTGTHALNLGTGAVSISSATILAVNGSTLTIEGIVSGSQNFTKAGVGTLSFTGANNFTGNLTVANGTLTFSAGNSDPLLDQPLGKGDVIKLGQTLISSGTLVYTGATATTLAKIIEALGNGGDTIENAGGARLTLTGGLITTATTLKLKAGANGITASGIISGIGGSLIVEGDTILTNANTYNGGTTISSGTLSLSGAGRLSDAGVVNLTGASSRFNIEGINVPSQETIAHVTGVSGSKVQLGSSSLILGDNADYAFAGDIEGTGGSITKGGTGTATFSGSNTYSGSTNLTLGTLLLGSSTALPTGAALNLSSGTKLNTGGFSATTGALALGGSSTIDLGAGSGSDLSFTTVSAWSGILSIWNYTGGGPGILSTGDSILLGSPGSINLAQVHFYSDSGVTEVGPGGARLIGNELVPVPEPVAVGSALLLLAAMGWRERKTFLHLREAPPNSPLSL